MSLILGIETSCDETGIAIYDNTQKKLLSHALFSQISLHEIYGGVVPEIASRSQLEKITIILATALRDANITLDNIDVIAVTHKPGLVGSLLVGVCFAKGLAWAGNKKIIGIDHIEGHIFSSFLRDVPRDIHDTHDTRDTSNTRISSQPDIPFPHICLTVSGGHTALYHVKDFGDFTLLAETLDDAAGEAFDKIAKVMGFSYPGGPMIEKLASEVNFQDFFKYPRTKIQQHEPMFSFSGLKTAVLYSLVKQGAYDLHTGPIHEKLTPELMRQVASSLLVCIGDIFCNNIKLIFKKYPEIKALTFVGGVACNKYLRARLQEVCTKMGKQFFIALPKFCTDNGAMIAFVGGYKAEQEKFSDLHLDVLK